VTQAFIGELTRVAEITGSQHLSAMADRLRRPVRVAVVGRDGVGRGRVEAALRLRGVSAAAHDGGGLDVCVLVVAESVKSEDLALARSLRRPVLIVLTKADLSGAGVGGPITVARSRAAAIRGLTGVPTVPMVGLLAALDDLLDADLVAALGTFVTVPPNLTAVDAFVEDSHPVGREVRVRLLELLDRFGIAHAVLAIADGCAPETLPGHLSRLGNVDEVLAELEVVAAAVRYRRVRSAIAELCCLAAQLDEPRVSELVTADVTVLAAMGAAVDVVEAAGGGVDRGDTPAAHRDRAIRWRRYGLGPVNALHRQCSADIVRGSLRLLGGGAAR
jgi:hypothetical protein